MSEVTQVLRVRLNRNDVAEYREALETLHRAGVPDNARLVVRGGGWSHDDSYNELEATWTP